MKTKLIYNEMDLFLGSSIVLLFAFFEGIYCSLASLETGVHYLPKEQPTVERQQCSLPPFLSPLSSASLLQSQKQPQVCPEGAHSLMGRGQLSLCGLLPSVGDASRDRGFAGGHWLLMARSLCWGGVWGTLPDCGRQRAGVGCLSLSVRARLCLTSLMGSRVTRAV